MSKMRIEGIRHLQLLVLIEDYPATIKTEFSDLFSKEIASGHIWCERRKFIKHGELTIRGRRFVNKHTTLEQWVILKKKFRKEFLE